MTDIEPDKRYYNIIRRIDVAASGEILFYFTGMQNPMRVIDFVAGTTNHARLSALESRIRNHNVIESKRYAKAREHQV